jgi:hypothetical protein
MPSSIEVLVRSRPLDQTRAGLSPQPLNVSSEVAVKTAAASLRICLQPSVLTSTQGPAIWQLRNDVVVPAVAQRVRQIVQGGSKKSQKTSLQLSVQA